MGNFCFIPPKPLITTIAPESSIVGNNCETDTDITSKLSSISIAERNNSQILEVPNLRIYSYYELKTATRNFKPDMAIGGGFGPFGNAFKGWVDMHTLNPIKADQGIVVTVKILDPEDTNKLEEWQAEVDFLGRLSHPNLVKLLGYCSDARKLLVYEYMAKGSLVDHLFRKTTDPETLPWSIRLKIATGAAQGLAFLHYCKKRAVYAEFHPSNILLDSDYNPKLHDFRITKNEPAREDCWVSEAVHTYAAPEYVARGHLSMKSDVYGFGVVLLEMLSGQRAFVGRGQNLVYQVRLHLRDRRNLIKLVMDKKLEGQYNPKAALQAAQLTLHCLDDNPRNRPSTEEVVNILQKVEATTLSNGGIVKVDVWRS